MGTLLLAILNEAVLGLDSPGTFVPPVDIDVAGTGCAGDVCTVEGQKVLPTTATIAGIRGMEERERGSEAGTGEAVDLEGPGLVGRDEEERCKNR